MRVVIFTAFLLTALAAGCPAQRKASPIDSVPAVKIAEGVLYFVGSGNGITDCVLQTESGPLLFKATPQTRFTKPSGASVADSETWKLGARWRVRYVTVPRGAVAAEVNHLGRVDAVAEADELARGFLDSLLEKDFAAAYEKLGPAAKRKLTFEDFTKLYAPQEISMRGRIICAHSEDGGAVRILLAPHGADGGDLYQSAELGKTDGRWLIERIGEFRETAGGCAGLD
jgi:hypothetical protein